MDKSKKRVLVLNPATKKSKNVVRDILYGCWCNGKRIGKGTVPPFYLLLIATVIKDAGYDVTFFDALGEGKTIEDAPPGPYDYLVCSTSTMTFNEDVQALNFYKQHNPSIKTFIYGSHATFMPKYCMKHDGVDFCVRQEPEITIRELINKLTNGEDYSEMPAISFRNAAGEVQRNRGISYVEEPDELPFLDTSMLPRNVEYFNPLVERFPYITMITSKGCPAKCTFCTSPFIYGKSIRYQSAKRVVDEVEQHLNNGYREIYFRDETFNADAERTFQMCDQIIERKLDVVWICNSRVDSITRDMMVRMKEAGCHYIKFGVEHYNQEMLDRVRKGYLAEDCRKVFKWAHEVGVDTHAHMMLGMPGETKETMEKNIRYAIELDPTTVTFGVCTPYPGTPLFIEVAKNHPEIEDGSINDLSILHTEGIFNEAYTSLTKEELSAGIREAYRAFYTRPRYLWNSLRRIKNPSDMRRIAVAGSNVLDFALAGG